MATITEDYVSFETAKLLKEKGFNEKTEYVYSDSGELLKLSHLGIKDLTNADCNKYHTWQFPIEGVASIISAPTLQMAMKWLREVHNIFIEISVSIDLNGNYHYHYSVLDKECKYVRKGYTDFDYDYKQACEAAIKYSLENLI